MLWLLLEELIFLFLANQARADHGLPPLTNIPALEAAAEWKSQDMGENHYFAHRDWSANIKNHGFSQPAWLGENIAGRVSTGAGVFKVWKSSPDHWANILEPHFRFIGISAEYVPGSAYGWYWTTVFAGPKPILAWGLAKN